MPINKEEFMKLWGNNPVEEVLKKNKNKAYTAKEIANKLRWSVNRVSGRLKTLKTKRKVLHHTPYWMIRR